MLLPKEHVFLGPAEHACNPSAQRLMQEDRLEFKAGMGYVLRLCLKTEEEQEEDGKKEGKERKKKRRERGKGERGELILASSLQEYSGTQSMSPM